MSNNDEAKFRKLELYREQLFRTEPSLSRSRDLFMKRARELFPGRDIRWNAKTENVEVAEFDADAANKKA